MALRNRGEIRDWVIYKITNPNGRIYIGKTVNMTARIRSYKCQKSVSQQPLVFRSFQKYGFENHTFEIIDSFTSNNDYCKGKEIFWIRTYMSNINKYPEQKGMNLTDGGDGTLGFKKSDEERVAMVKRYTGRKQSDEQRKKASERHKGNKYNLGRTPSKETRLKMSLANNGISELCKKRSLEVKRKPVIQYDANGGIIKEYESLVAASKYFCVSRDCVARWVNNPNGKRTYSEHKSVILKYK